MSPTFTTLPQEVRGQIYRNVFHCDRISPLYARYNSPYHLSRCLLVDEIELLDPQRFLALLCTNRQVSPEAEMCSYIWPQSPGHRPTIEDFVQVLLALAVGT